MSESKKKFSRSDVTSFIAVILSVAALVIGLVETRIMAEQQKTMVAQQKASVWPYMKVSSGIQLTDSLVFSAVAENKGVGPALIREIKIGLKDEVYNDFNDFSKSLDQILGKDNYTISRFGFSETVSSVYKPGEEKTLFAITIYDQEAFFEKVGHFPVSLTYCSIYDDCWRENGQEIPDL